MGQSSRCCTGPVPFSRGPSGPTSGSISHPLQLSLNFPLNLIGAMISLTTDRLYAEDSRFVDHLIAVLDVRNQGTEPAPEWRGSDEPRFRTILRSLDALCAGSASKVAHTPRKRTESEAATASADDSATSMLEDEILAAAGVCAAVARGDLSKKLIGPVHGTAMGELQEALNGMVDKLAVVSRELTRVSYEVGAQGILSNRRASVKDAKGVWLELTHSVRGVSPPPPPPRSPNALAQTNQAHSAQTDMLRSIATVVHAVANGDLTHHRVEIEAKGELATIKVLINTMADTLAALAAEVAGVAHEVGSQGVLGGQARIEGAQGAWADLTLSVNVCVSVTCRMRPLTLLRRKWRTPSLTKCARLPEWPRRLQQATSAPMLAWTLMVRRASCWTSTWRLTRWWITCAPSRTRSLASRARSARREGLAAGRG
jgi:HAMP domain-containing protein